MEHESELPDAIDACRSIDPQECRKTAEQLFALDKMIDRYIDTYHQRGGEFMPDVASGMMNRKACDRMLQLGICKVSSSTIWTFRFI